MFWLENLFYVYLIINLYAYSLIVSFSVSSSVSLVLAFKLVI